MRPSASFVVFALLLCTFHVRAQPAPISDAVTVVSGEAHSCALNADGGVSCWGANDFGQLGNGTFAASARAVDVSGLTSGVNTIAAGSNHTCALMSGTGAVRCWGANGDGQIGDGTTTHRAVPVDVGLTLMLSVVAGTHHTCAVHGGGIKCWGRNDDGQLGDGTTTDRASPVDVSGVAAGVTMIALGGMHTCALPSAGPPLCWGANSSGQLGNGTFTASPTATAVTGVGANAQAIAAGFDHTCAIDSGAGVVCWGANGSGQLGNGVVGPSSSTPVAVNGLSTGVTFLAAGAGLDLNVPGSGIIRGHTCASVGGAAKCWGYNGNGQLGDGTTTKRSSPVDVVGLPAAADILSISGVGRAGHTCAKLASGAVYCWGSNRTGQLGNAPNANRPTAVPIQLPATIAGISAGGVHSCAYNAGGFAKCWGYNSDGRLGDGTYDARALPTAVTSLATGVQKIVAGGTHSCAIVGGAVKCWGANTFGQLGDNTQSVRNVPVDVAGLAGVDRIALGAEHTCAIAGGGLKCWGRNFDGELGDGTNTQRLVPTDVTGLGGGGVAAVGTGSSLANTHTCALTALGGVMCWGYNGYGQLGNGTFTASNVPVAVTGLSTGMRAIAVGGRHACALGNGGGVQCWGDNASGQLGNGSHSNATTPVAVSGLSTGVEAIAAGELATCALLDDGTVRCWGANFNHQLGDGTTHVRNTPVAVLGLPAAVDAISVGAGHACALAANAAYCWGNNDAGQIGDGSLNLRTSPVAAVADGTPRQVVTLTPASNAGSTTPASSASGRWVAFQSDASNLVASDTNGTTDVFRVDTETGAVERISVDDGDGQIASPATEPAISADGSLLLFVTDDAGIAKLMGEDEKRRAARMKASTLGVFMRNLLTGSTQRIGTAPPGGGSLPQISADGGTIVFGTINTDPMQGMPGKGEVFRVPLTRVGNERLPGATTCVSCKAVNGFGIPGGDTDGASEKPSLSADGEWIVYQTTAKNALSAAPAPCPASSSDLILRNLLTGVSQRIGAPANVANCGAAGTGSTSAQIDWAGLRIAFESDQPLKPGDANASRDIYFVDLSRGTLDRVSETPFGGDGNGAATQPTLSGDGNVVGYVSGANNLDLSAPDTNDRIDVHVRNLRTGTTRRLSQTADGTQADADSQRPALNYNGTRLAFDSTAGNLAPGGAAGQPDVYQRANPTTSDSVFGANFE